MAVCYHGTSDLQVQADLNFLCVCFLILHLKNFIYLFSAHVLWYVGFYFFLLQWKQSLNHWTTREVKLCFEIKFHHGLFGKMS